jgi:hypothetical protein
MRWIYDGWEEQLFEMKCVMIMQVGGGNAEVSDISTSSTAICL